MGCQVCGGVAKAVVAWPKSWGCGQARGVVGKGFEGVAKAVGA